MTEQNEAKPIFSDEQVIEALRRYRLDFSQNAYISVALLVRDVVERAVLEQSLERLFAESAAWSEATFPQATPSSISVHLRREADELEENPLDSSEMADVQLLLNHLVFKTGTNLKQVVKEKLEVNKQRKWGTVDSQGVVEHVRDTPPRTYMRLDKDGRPFGLNRAE